MDKAPEPLKELQPLRHVFQRVAQARAADVTSHVSAGFDVGERLTEPREGPEGGIAMRFLVAGEGRLQRPHAKVPEGARARTEDSHVLVVLPLHDCKELLDDDSRHFAHTGEVGHDLARQGGVGRGPTPPNEAQEFHAIAVHLEIARVCLVEVFPLTPQVGQEVLRHHSAGGFRLLPVKVLATEAEQQV